MYGLYLCMHQIPGCGSQAYQVLHGIPLPPSQAGRLGQLGQRLGKGSISVLIDSVPQLQSLRSFRETAGFSCKIFMKIDTGYGRAGLTTASPEFQALVKSILEEVEPVGDGKLCGFYSHVRDSYFIHPENHEILCILQ